MKAFLRPSAATLGLSTAAGTQHWAAHAACRTEAATFDAAMTHPNVKAAKRICKDCPVAADCLQWALDEGEPHGILGGLTPNERYNLKRRRRRA